MRFSPKYFVFITNPLYSFKDMCILKLRHWGDSSLSFSSLAFFLWEQANNGIFAWKWERVKYGNSKSNICKPFRSYPAKDILSALQRRETTYLKSPVELELWSHVLFAGPMLRESGSASLISQYPNSGLAVFIYHICYILYVCIRYLQYFLITRK